FILHSEYTTRTAKGFAADHAGFLQNSVISTGYRGSLASSSGVVSSSQTMPISAAVAARTLPWLSMLISQSEHALLTNSRKPRVVKRWYSEKSGVSGVSVG